MKWVGSVKISAVKSKSSNFQLGMLDRKIEILSQCLIQHLTTLSTKLIFCSFENLTFFHSGPKKIDQDLERPLQE